MSVIKHKIDPFGDTVITLRNPGAPFAVWDESTEVLADVEDPSDLGKDAEVPLPVPEQSTMAMSKKESKKERKERKRYLKKRAAEASGRTDPPAPLEVVTERTNGASNEEPEAIPVSNVDNEVATSTANVDTDEPTNGHEDNEIQYLVSSRHLMMVSPWFRRRFTTSTFSESRPSSVDGRYHFTTSDWDEEALLILLNIFHLRTRQVPTEISLEMFAKIAVIADYYELEDEQALDRDIKNWVERLWINFLIPNTYCRDLVLWICVSRVFRLTEQFEQVTAVAIKTSCGWIQDLGLPIHGYVTSEIDRIRCHAIEQIIAKLHQLVDRYGDSKYVCPSDWEEYSAQCGVNLYGSLMRYMKDWEYLTPRPMSPFVGMCFEKVCDKVKMARSPQWWHEIPNLSRYGEPRGTVHPCKLHSAIDEVVKTTTAEIAGLKLENHAVASVHTLGVYSK